MYRSVVQLQGMKLARTKVYMMYLKFPKITHLYMFGSPFWVLTSILLVLA